MASGAAIDSASGLSAPAGSDELEIRIGKLEIVGGFSQLTQTSIALAASIDGKRVSLAQIYLFVSALEQAYARAGFVLVRVTLPPQRLRENGPVKVVVVDGYIERIETKGLEARVRAAVVARTETLIGRTHITLGEIERAVLIAGDVPGLSLKSALARGDKPGGALLVLEGQQRIVTGALGSDNKLPDSLGGSQWNASLALNGAMGLGEQAYLTLGSGFAMTEHGFPNSPLEMIGGGLILPLGADGFTLNPEYTRSVTRPNAAPGAPDSIGDFERLALRASFPLLRDRSQTLNLSGAVETISQGSYAPSLGADINRDDYGALRVGLNWQAFSPWGAPFQGDFQISQGLGGRNAADAQADGVPLSRRGAAPDFSKFNGDFRLNQALAADFRLDLFGHLQASWAKPLLQSEAFALDGPDALSAFPSGTFSVDTGETLRAELTHAFAVPTSVSAMTVSPYLFAAQGAGWLYQPTAVEQAETFAAALGLGAHLAIDLPDGFTSTKVGIEIGRQYSNVVGRRDSNRINFVASSSF